MMILGTLGILLFTMNMLIILKYSIVSIFSFAVLLLIPLLLRKYPAAQKKLKIYVISLTVLLLLYYAIIIFNIPVPEKLARLIHIIFITAISLSLVKIVSIIVFDVYLELQKQLAVPKLLKDLINLLAYLAIFLLITHFIMGWELTPVLATSAVVTVILGFALQDTL